MRGLRIHVLDRGPLRTLLRYGYRIPWRPLQPLRKPVVLRMRCSYETAGAAPRKGVTVHVGKCYDGVVEGSVNVHLSFLDLAYVTFFLDDSFLCHCYVLPYLAAFLPRDTVRLGPFLVRAFCFVDCPLTGKPFL